MSRTVSMMLLAVAALFVGSVLIAQEDQSPGEDGEQQGEEENFQAASVDYFHDALAPYGRWVTRDGYGLVWVPAVEAGWKPYTVGHWVNTEQGFAWAADEVWGWGPFHYGRWYVDPELGWSWIPGSVWAPAWVAWQTGAGFFGWAPLPPAVGFAGGGIAAIDTLAIAPGVYTFVLAKDFLAPHLDREIIPSRQNTSIVRVTSNVTSYTVVKGRVLNAAVSEKRVRDETGHTPARVSVSSLSSGKVILPAKGRSSQPGATGRGALAVHEEFGEALPRQVKDQQHKSNSYAQVAGQSGRANTPYGQPRTDYHDNHLTTSHSPTSSGGYQTHSKSDAPRTDHSSRDSRSAPAHPYEASRGNASAASGLTHEQRQPQSSKGSEGHENAHQSAKAAPAQKSAPEPKHQAAPPPRPTPHH